MTLTTTMYLGASASMQGYNKTDSYRHLMFGGGSNPGGGTGQLGSRRCFNGTGDGIPVWSLSAADAEITDPWDDNVGLGCSSTWISFKPDAADFIAGLYDGDLVAFINSTPANHRVLITLWHEPEDNFLTAQQQQQYRDMTKRAHRLVVSNRGSKDIWFGPCYNDHLFDEDSAPHDDLSKFWPVYASGDTIPAGFAVGDPCMDFVGFDFYDRDRDWFWARREWDPLAGGNPNGMTGYLDKIVSEYQITKPAFTRGNLVWACGEIGTKRGRTDDAPYSHPDDPVAWWSEIVTKAVADPSTCLELNWFHNDAEGDAAPWDMDGGGQSGLQNWIAVNGSEFNPPPAIGESLSDTYDVAGVTTTLVSNSVELQHETAGLVGTTLELRFQVTGYVNDELVLQWQTSQLLPILPTDTLRGTSDVSRLQSGAPGAERPSAPGVEPA